MTKATRARYTLEFKLEAVRLVKGGQSMAATAKILGIAEQTLHNWIRADKDGRLMGAGTKPVSPEQMEIARLRAELARVKMERDIGKLPSRHAAPHVHRNKQCLHFDRARSEAACFLEALTPLVKPGPGGAADPVVVAPCATPFRKLI